MNAVEEPHQQCNCGVRRGGGPHLRLLLLTTLWLPSEAFRCGGVHARLMMCARHNMISMGTITDELQPGDDLFAIIGVSRQSSSDEIRRAYRARARLIHPDVNRAPDAALQFRRLVAAFEILSDEQRRAAWQQKVQANAAWDELHRMRDGSTGWRAAYSQRRPKANNRNARDASMLHTLTFVAVQWLVWFTFLQAAAHISR